MSYDKLSLASFTEALKSGKYETATAARRGVGKATTLSEADKDKARKLIDAKFGSGPTPSKKTAKAAPKKKAVAVPKKKAAAAPKKAAAAKAAPAPKKVAAAASKRQPQQQKRQAQPAVPAFPASVPSIDLENLTSISTQIRVAEKTIQNVGAAMNVITQAKDKYPDADLQSALEEMGMTLSGACNIFRTVVHAVVTSSQNGSTESTGLPAVKGPEAPRAPVVQQPTAPVVPQLANNGVQPTRAESLFRESAPTADTPAEV